MRRWVAAFGVSGMLWSQALAAETAGGLSDLYALLLRTQNEVVTGGAELLPLQQHVLATMGAALSARSKEDAWSESDAVAVIGYGFAGGDPRHLRHLLDGPALPEGLDGLARGLVAYRADRKDAAMRHFGALAEDTIPPVLQPAVAMIRGTLALDDQPSDARAQFRKAAQLAPGTLVEEAALRRLMGLHTDTPDDLFRLARQHWQRFPKSPYRHRVGSLLQAAILTLDTPRVARELDRLLPLLPERARFAFLSNLSRQALLNGQSDLVRLVVSRMRVAETGAKAIAARNNALLEDVAQLTSDKVEGIAKRLASLDPTLLSRQNKALLSASRQVAEAILAPLAEPVVAMEETENPSGEMQSYRARLTAIDKLLDD